MKRYIFFVVIGLSSVLCLAASKKNKDLYKKNSRSSNIETYLQRKITTITQLIPDKPFEFDSHAKKDLFEQYIEWSKKLSKQELLKIIAYQEQNDRGFSQKDAQDLIDRLQNQPLSNIYDIFIHYQKRFVISDIPKSEGRTSVQRLEQLHQNYEAEQNQMSYVRRLPIIHNLEVNLLPDITHLTDQQLYQKIADEMARIGFSQEVIEDEQSKLKHSSIETLQREMPHIQDELAERLQYFNGTKSNSPRHIVNADYYLGLLHTWTTTAASIIASGASLLGLNPLALQMIASSNILNPYFGQKQNISKRQMLAMIYAQYKSYNALEDMYLDPKFKELELLTKSQILDLIKDHMAKMGISSELISKKISKYKQLNKSELEILAEEFNYFAQNYQDLDISTEEAEIAVLTKDDLVREIKKYVSKFSISKQEKEELLANVQKEDSNFARAVLLDLIKADSDKNYLKLPQVLSTKEKVLIKSPKILSDAIGQQVIDHLQHEWQQEGKSRMYQYWKTQALRNKLAEKQEGFVDRAPDAYNRINFARALLPV